MSLGRRKHLRTKANDGDVLHSVYKCLDISESGMKFHSIRKVRLGSAFKVELCVFDEPIEITCKVMWCRETTVVYEDGFHLGVKFEDFSVLNQLRLRELIDKRE